MSRHADTIRATDDEWRTQPTDLGGWANRAAQMKATADALLAENQRLREDSKNLAAEVLRLTARLDARQALAGDEE